MAQLSIQKEFLDKMSHKSLSILGIIAPITYIITVILGGAITIDYSHSVQAISELTATGSQHKPLLDILFSAYNIMLMGFGAGLLQFVNGKPSPQLIGKAGSWCLILIGVMGLSTNLFFPMDPRGVSPTLIGNIHLVLAGLLSLGTILTTLFIGVWFLQQPGDKKFGMISFIACAVIVITGGLAAAAAASASPIMGIVQRMTIGVFMLWILLLGMKLTSFSKHKIT